MLTQAKSPPYRRTSVEATSVPSLPEARLRARHPVGHPVDHLLQPDARRAEEPLRFAGIDKPCRFCLFAGEERLAGKPAPERLGKRAYAHLRAAHIDGT